jgi:hypothetical protein
MGVSVVFDSYCGVCSRATDSMKKPKIGVVTASPQKTLKDSRSATCNRFWFYVIDRDRIFALSHAMHALHHKGFSVFGYDKP